MKHESIEAAFQEGDPVPAWLGDNVFPVGEVGTPYADARLLAAVLAADGPAGRMLRAFGIDEGAIRALAGRDI